MNRHFVWLTLLGAGLLFSTGCFGPDVVLSPDGNLLDETTPGFNEKGEWVIPEGMEDPGDDPKGAQRRKAGPSNSGSDNIGVGGSNDSP